MLLVDVDLAGLKAVTPLPVPCFQPLATVRGCLAALPAALAEAAQAGRPGLPVWLDVEVGTDDYLADLQPRVAQMVEGLPVEVLRVRRARSTPAVAGGSPAGETLDELGPDDVFDRRLAAEILEPALQDRLRVLYRSVVADLQEGGAA